MSVSGHANLNIIIRSAVVAAGTVSVGAGGAVVAMSQPEEEYQEMILKATNVLRAVALATYGDANAYSIAGASLDRSKAVTSTLVDSRL